MKNPYDQSCPSLYRGIVESNEDPESLGRCRVRVPSIHGDLNYPVSILPWARPLVLSPVGKNRGSVNIPEVGDIVWVIFEGSDRDFPIYLGGTYATGDVPINLKRVDFYIDNGNRISYHRDTDSYEVLVGDTRFSVSSSGVVIDGNITVNGSITSTGDIKGNQVSLSSHIHGGVYPGSADTNKPR